MSSRSAKKFTRHYKQGTLFQVAGNIFKTPVRHMNRRLPGLKRDLSNKIRYGISAPRYMERIWIDPQKVEGLITREEIKRVAGMTRNEASGYVIDWDEIRETIPLMDEFRMQYCFKHWREGLSWEELGVYEHMSTTKKYGRDPKRKIIARFDMLDRAFEEVRQEGRLKTRQEIDPSNFREEDGILIHIGKEGLPYFGGNGFHRLAIAKVLELNRIPACIGVVDKKAIELLSRYRKS